MSLKQLRCAILAALFALLAAPPHARAGAWEHTYEKDEYGIVVGGWAPNKRLSIAAHGEGKGGHDNFHLYLMAEPRHRPLATLDDIGQDNNLDANNFHTDPDVFYAAWSPDSHYVTVSFRSDRQLWRLNLYVIEAGRARRIDAPDLFREATGRSVELKPGSNVRNNFFTVEWLGPRRFRLNDYRMFVHDDTALADKLGDLGSSTRMSDGRYRIEFAAKADVTLGRSDRTRIGRLRQGTYWQ